jgi:signal transduction histidine kinase
VSDPFWFILGFFCGVIIAVVAGRSILRAGAIRARRAERRAAEAERLAELGSMTSGLAHEIKNPLSTVGLNAQLIDEGIRELDIPEEQASPLLRRVESLGREADRLREILTDFLQFAGQVRLDPQPIDIVAVLEELADFFHPQSDARGVVLRAELPRESIVVAADVGLIKQAVLNLMLNAVQAMQAASDQEKELILRLESDHTEARIHVIDTGPGVPEDMRETIFHPYVTGSPGGTGLGLPTTRRIAEEHGGSVSLEVLPGRGSDFIIHLPRQSTQTEPAADQPGN